MSVLEKNRAWIEENYSSMSNKDIAQKLGVTSAYLRSFASRNGLKKIPDATIAKCLALLQAPERKPYKEIAKETGCQVRFIWSLAKKNGLQRNARWNPKRETFLRKNASKMTDKEIAQAIGMSTTAVKNKRLAFNISRRTNLWTAEEDKIIRENLSIPRHQLQAKLPHRTLQSVYQRASRLTERTHSKNADFIPKTLNKSLKKTSAHAA